MADRIRIRIPFRWWLERFRTILSESRQYRRRWQSTPEPLQVMQPMLLPSLVCAAVGHSWPAPNGAITLAPWSFSFCSRCHEELCGRASFAELEVKPDDAWDEFEDAWSFDEVSR